MRTPLTTASLLGLATMALALALPASEARADCSPGAFFCAEARLQIGGRAHGHARVAHGRHIRHRRSRRRVIVVRPAPPPPPVVVVEAQPAPPPPPAPPPRHVVTVEHQHRVRVRQEREPKVGLHFQAGGLIAERLHMGGFGGALRLRPVPAVGIDLGIAGYGGRDWNGLDRIEVPVTADFLFFVNPRSRVQFYFLVGGGVSWAHAEGVNRHTGRFTAREFAYAGGEAGIGLEWRINRHFGLNLDGRGFLRTRIDSNDDRPEFVEHDEDGRPTGNVSDTSGGGLLTVGGTIYF